MVFFGVYIDTHVLSARVKVVSCVPYYGALKYNVSSYGKEKDWIVASIVLKILFLIAGPPIVSLNSPLVDSFVIRDFHGYGVFTK